MAPRSSKHDPVPPLEWVSAALGLLIVLALLVIVSREIIDSSADDLPVLEARIEAIKVTPTGHVAQFVVSNRSNQTAAAVQLEGKLGSEVASASVDYVPGNSESRGGLLFQGDPRGARVEVRVIGYELP